MANKITIFDILATIDAKDVDFYDNLPEVVQKAEHPLVLMKWMLGCNDPAKILLLNEMVNPYVFPLSRQKPMVMKLLTVCADGKRTRYKWIPRKKAKTTKYPALVALIQQQFQYSSKHALDALPVLTGLQLLQFAEEMGYQKKEMSDIKKEIKKRDKK